MGRKSRGERQAATGWPRPVPGVPRRRALLVGIAAAPGADALNTYEDVNQISSVLIEKCGYQQEDIIIMTDAPSTPHYLKPTRRNLICLLRKLVRGAQRGDRHFFFYSGHGIQLKCEEGSDESDGMDECLKCSDGFPLRDNRLREILVDSLPGGTHLFALFDACHAGTMLDLPHRRCNQSFSIGLALHNLTRFNRSIMSLPSSFSSLSTPRTSPLIPIQELPRTPSMSPLILAEDTVTSPTSFDHYSSGSFGSFPSSPGSALDSLPVPTSLLLSSPLPVQSTISSDPPSPHTPPLGRPHELTLDIPSDFESPKRIASEKCTGLCSPVDNDAPVIVSLASTADSETSWEDQSGGPMTKAFVAIVREADGNLTYDDLMVRLRDRFADGNVDRWVAWDNYRRACRDAGCPPEDFEKPQRPQLSSLVPLDMDLQIVF